MFDKRVSGSLQTKLRFRFRKLAVKPLKWKQESE